MQWFGNYNDGNDNIIKVKTDCNTVYFLNNNDSSLLLFNYN